MKKAGVGTGAAGLGPRRGRLSTSGLFARNTSIGKAAFFSLQHLHASVERETERERVAEAFMTDSAFAACREDENLWNAT